MWLNLFVTCADMDYGTRYISKKSKGVKRLYAFQKQLYPTIVDAILNLMAFHAFKMGFTWDEDVSYTVNTSHCNKQGVVYGCLSLS